MAWKGVITNAGNSLLGQWTNGAVLCIAGAAAGTGVVDEVSLMAQTALKNQIQTVSIASCDTVNGAKRLRIQIPPADVAYPLNQIAVFARIGDGEAQLLALYQNSAGVDIPAAEESPDFLYTFYGLLGFDNTGELKVTIDSGASVTMEALSEELAKHTNEQTPTFAQAEKLENIASGEKMTTLMGKIMKAIADFIAHVKNGNHVAYSETAPVMDGDAAAGTAETVARSDHKHPSDTTRAPKSHAASGTDYGAGSGSNYGHVKLSDATDGTSDANGGVAATPAAVKAAYDLANSRAQANHGNHVPATEAANNARFLRNDNTWQKVTPANIGAAESSHSQAASTITAGTFAGPVVANSSGQTPGTSLLRNSMLVSVETTPTVNGEICWTYE